MRLLNDAKSLYLGPSDRSEPVAVCVCVCDIETKQWADTV